MVIHSFLAFRADGPAPIDTQIVESGLLPFLLGLTAALSDEVARLRVEVAHLYRRETINKRESDQVGRNEIGARAGAWRTKLGTLATLCQTMEALLRRATEAGSDSGLADALLLSCRDHFCKPYDVPIHLHSLSFIYLNEAKDVALTQTRTHARAHAHTHTHAHVRTHTHDRQVGPTEMREALYRHLVRLFKASQNFFLAGLIVRALLTLTRGFRKRIHVAFPIYRSLSLVYPSAHFLASFPRTLASASASAFTEDRALPPGIMFHLSSPLSLYGSLISLSPLFSWLASREVGSCGSLGRASGRRRCLLLRLRCAYASLPLPPSSPLQGSSLRLPRLLHLYVGDCSDHLHLLRSTWHVLERWCSRLKTSSQPRSLSTTMSLLRCIQSACLQCVP